MVICTVGKNSVKVLNIDGQKYHIDKFRKYMYKFCYFLNLTYLF